MIEQFENTENEETQLVVRLSKGDQNAFEALYDQYKRRLTANVFRLVKSRELAKEIVQELFLKVWDRRAEIDPEKPFSAYLFRIAGNLVADYFRKASRDRRMMEKMLLASTELYSHIEEHIFREEDKALLERAVSLMPSQRQEVYRLCKLEGRSYREVEEIMGIGVKTINSHLYQASLFLKKHFGRTPPVVVAIILRSIFRGL